MPSKSKTSVKETKPKSTATQLAQIGQELSNTAKNKQNIVDVTPEAPAQKRLGRKKRPQSNNNPNTIYLSDEMQHLIDEIEFNSRIRKQELVRTALYYFFKQFRLGNLDALNEGGMATIREYLRSVGE